jgi:hypothetical protein
MQNVRFKISKYTSIHSGIMREELDLQQYWAKTKASAQVDMYVFRHLITGMAHLISNLDRRNLIGEPYA